MLSAETQNQMISRFAGGVSRDNWLDWRWHVRHSVRDLAAFEKVAGIRFAPEERPVLEETLERFPLSITPYYLSWNRRCDRSR